MGKKTKVAIAIAAASAAAWAGSKAVAKPQKRESKEVLTTDRPIVLANRGGAHLAPENTAVALAKAAEYGVDGFVVGIRLTKDEEIILFNDETIDRTTNGSGFVKDYTLAELNDFNHGYNFESLDEENPYREEAVGVMTLREALETHEDKLFAIEIKDSPDTYEGSLMPSKLWRLLEELDAQLRVIVRSDFSEQIDRFNLYAQNRVALGAGEADIKKAFTAFTSQFGHLYNPKVDVFQLPLKAGLFNYDSPKFIKFLADLNVPIHYTGINDLATMSRVARQGAQAIITDRPDIAATLLKKFEV